MVIHLSDKFLEAFDAQTNLLAHFPCSIAAQVEKRPVGELHVVVIAPNPNYTLDPELFPESAELQAIGHKLILPPGPNNPVGVAWIGSGQDRVTAFTARPRRSKSGGRNRTAVSGWRTGTRNI